MHWDAKKRKAQSKPPAAPQRGSPLHKQRQLLSDIRSETKARPHQRAFSFPNGDCRAPLPCFFNIKMPDSNTQILSEFDFIVVVDASGSMSTDDVKGRSRWDAVQETAEQFTRDLAKIDSDGIGLVIFNGQGVKSFDGVDAKKLTEVFASTSPRSSTPLAEALNEALKLAGKSDKKDFIIVFTDGVPDDKAAAAQVIKDAANRQETDDALTILFVQVGHDAAATAYLRELDDNLKDAKFDIVDAKTVTEAEAFATTADLVLAAIND